MTQSIYVDPHHGPITQEQYDAKCAELKQEQARLDFTFKAFQGDDDEGLMRFAAAMILGLSGRDAIDKAMEVSRG